MGFFKFNKAPTYNKKYAYIIFFKIFIQCKNHNTKDEIKENGIWKSSFLSIQQNRYWYSIFIVWKNAYRWTVLKILTMIITCVKKLYQWYNNKCFFPVLFPLCCWIGVDKTRTIQLRHYNNLYYCNEEISLHMYIWRIYIFSHSYTVYTERFALVLFLPRSPSLSTGKIKTGRMSMSQIISLKCDCV